MFEDSIDSFPPELCLSSWHSQPVSQSGPLPDTCTDGALVFAVAVSHSLIGLFLCSCTAGFLSSTSIRFITFRKSSLSFFLAVIIWFSVAKFLMIEAISLHAFAWTVVPPISSDSVCPHFAFASFLFGSFQSVSVAIVALCLRCSPRRSPSPSSSRAPDTYLKQILLFRIFQSAPYVSPPSMQFCSLHEGQKISPRKRPLRLPHTVPHSPTSL